MKHWNLFISFVERKEPWLFFTLTILFLFPIWSLDFFPTLDGQAHVFNSHVLWELWFGKSQLYEQYFVANTQLNPNWISHPITAILAQFFQPQTCEKIILSLYLVFFVTAFRSMVFALKAYSVLMSLLGFAFVYNNTFVNGYFNYNFGLVLLMFSVSALLRFTEIQSVRRSVILSICVLLLYFSHLIAFCVFGLFVIIILCFQIFALRSKQSQPAFYSWKTIGKLIAIFFIPLALLIQYLLTSEFESSNVYLHAEDIIHDLVFLVNNNFISPREWSFSRWHWLVAVGGICAVLIITIARRNGSNTQPLIMLDKTGKLYLFFFFSLLGLTFLLPDQSSNGGGILTGRLIFLTTTFFLLFLFSLIKQKHVLFLMIFILVGVSVDKLFYVFREYKGLQGYCSGVDKASKVIDEAGIACVFDFIQKWPLLHVPKAIATNNELLVLDTWTHKEYTCVHWNDDLMNDSDVVSWVNSQWTADLNALEKKLGKRVKWFIINGNCTAYERDNNLCAKWEKFFSDSCIVFYVGEPEIVIYKRSE